jgi:hypothetical protein
MSDAPRPKPDPAPLELPPVDPVELERALRRAVLTPKPPGGWKRGRKGQDSEPPKSGNA